MAYGKALAFCGLAASALLAASMAKGADDLVDLDQGWTAPQVIDWYGRPQGSRLIPKSWFDALEQPGPGGGRFVDLMAGFNYVLDSEGWPIGFTEDRQDDTQLGATQLRWLRNQRNDEPWVGMTCAACHTGELRSGPHVMRVQGGPTLADFQSFYFAFTQALQETRSDPAKLARFEAKVLPPNPKPADRALLEKALSQLVAYQSGLAAMNRSHLSYGYGRLDAVGYILNKVSFVASPDAPSANEPDAPVSYPFLWNIGQQVRVQWDGIAQNAVVGSVDIGALGRNTGEVIGVFADVQPPKGFFQPTYRSSVQVRNLIAIEQQVATLKPPKWPRALFPVDDALAGEGRQLFADHCASCHAELPRGDLDTRRRSDGTPLERLNVLFPQAGSDPGITSLPADTDRWMACNTVTNQSATGRLKGQLTGEDLVTRFGDRAATSAMLAGVVKGVDLAKAGDVLDQINLAQVAKGFLTFKGSHPVLAPLPGVSAFALTTPQTQAQVYAARKDKCDAYASQRDHFKEAGYKGRPLTGVWATAPYLHNGSVPTLYDLLSPPDKRPTSFWLGAREFDPVNVGLFKDQTAQNKWQYRVVDETGQIIEGNSNRGHDYPFWAPGDDAATQDHKRRALVEYLKVIGEPAGG